MSVLRRIARAIIDALPGDDKPPSPETDLAYIDCGPVDMVEVARAVLKVMREPGPEAVAAMFDRLDCGELGEDFDTTDVWQAGIDAILDKAFMPKPDNFVFAMEPDGTVWRHGSYEAHDEFGSETDPNKWDMERLR